jgi:acyl-CoA synthetase (NDP forming)
LSTTDVIARARSEGRTVLTEVESKRILEDAGIPVIPTRQATDAEAAVQIAGEIGYPVVLKVVSPDVTHKSDAGGVRLGLDSADAVRAAYDGIVESVKRHEPEARVDGVSVQRMAEPGIEVIVGVSADPQFGPVLMFGLGGVLVEVLKDVAFRIVPLERRDARQMLREIKGFPVLEGVRGRDPADLAALEELLLKVSAFAEAHPEVAELDLNPVFAYKDGAVAVDARIVLG